MRSFPAARGVAGRANRARCRAALLHVPEAGVGAAAACGTVIGVRGASAAPGPACATPPSLPPPVGHAAGSAWCSVLGGGASCSRAVAVPVFALPLPSRDGGGGGGREPGGGGGGAGRCLLGGGGGGGLEPAGGGGGPAALGGGGGGGREPGA